LGKIALNPQPASNVSIYDRILPTARGSFTQIACFFSTNLWFLMQMAANAWSEIGFATDMNLDAFSWPWQQQGIGRGPSMDKDSVGYATFWCGAAFGTLVESRERRRALLG
jgi:hypothetical protein